MSRRSRWLDNPDRYGLTSRLLHWSMALLLIWQFVGMILKNLLGRSSELAGFMVSTHKPIGTILMLLILARGIWGLSQWRHRPSHPRNLVGKAAAAGHAALYLLMAWVPFVALLREYGSGKAFAPWGVPVFPGSGIELAWTKSLASATHSELAWVLLAVIAGHVAMVGVHHFFWRDKTLARMAGRLS